MKKFLVLYMIPSELLEMRKNISEEEHAKEMEKWKTWGEKHQANLVDFGSPVGANTRVMGSGTNEVANEVGGYSVVQGESKEAVIEILKDNPHLAGGKTYIELMEKM